MQVKKQQLELGMEEQTGSKLGNEYIKAVYCHPAYSTYMQSAAAAAKSLQLCPTLWDPIDGSPPGSPIPGILQARTLEWVTISFSNAWKWKVKVKSLSRVQFLATPWTAAYQTSPSLGFSRQEYWSGVPLPFPYMQNTSCEMLDWMKNKLESRFPGEISKPQICRWHDLYGRKWRRTKETLDES